MRNRYKIQAENTKTTWDIYAYNGEWVLHYNGSKVTESESEG
jgi:hypothetical protein